MRLINRRSQLFRLLLALSSGKEESSGNDENPHRFRRVDTVTPYQADALTEPTAALLDYFCLSAFVGSYLSCRNSLATVSPLELLVYR
jgi:hypothetical protein